MPRKRVRIPVYTGHAKVIVNALVDPEDYPRCRLFRWHSLHLDDRFRERIGIRPYTTVQLEDGSLRRIYMDHFVTNTFDWEPPPKIFHLDGQGLNCKKKNLGYAGKLTEEEINNLDIMWHISKIYLPRPKRIPPPAPFSTLKDYMNE